MVNRLEDAPRWRAPGSLEDVRRFLNTFEHLSRTRESRDHLPSLVRDSSAWIGRFGSIRQPRCDDVPALTALRGTLRAAVENRAVAAPINRELRAAPIVVAVDETGSGVRFVAAAEPTAITDILVIVAAAIAEGTWLRLRACPDCRLVFYDRTKNGSKRWCQMSAREGGRACGSIAKVQSWRGRRRDG